MNLGRYEVVRELGKGAMGIVYLAKDPLIGRLVALKTIRLSATTDDEEANEFQQRFMREAQAAGILNHPAIVTVHDIGQDVSSGVSFIAMEYVEGPNLKEIIQQGRKLEFSEIAEVLAQVAEALDYAHSKGIVHRDVKPANIILCGESRAKITDFGIAKIASSAANLTSTGQFLGTPNYMSPEQIKGTPVDGRTDIFSLGIVLYEALTGRKPFGGDSLTTISYKIVHDSFTPIHEINPDVPPPFERIVRKCLSKDPGDRYASGKDLAADLRRIFQNRPAKPVAVDPMLTEPTMVAAGERIPTGEVPFPEAAAFAPVETPKKTSGAFVVATPPASTPVTDIETRVKEEASRAAAAISTAAQRVMSRDFFSTDINPVIAWGIIGILFLLLGIKSWEIMAQRPETPHENVAWHKAVAEQHNLRMQGAQELKQGDVEAAYKTYQRLRQIAPGSPFVGRTLQKLDEVRFRELTYRQRLEQATQKLAEGKLLYDQKQYEKAIPLFEESFHLNPNLDEAVNYLKMAREQLSLQQRTPLGRLSTQVSVMPATLQTVFNSPVNDGYIVVKVNGRTIVQENLWEAQPGSQKRIPRILNITRQVPSGSVQVEAWLVIPTMKISAHRTFPYHFEAGGSKTLVVTLNVRSKLVDFRFA